MMRLTERQIRDIVATMRCTDKERAIILKRALGGDPGMRFVLYSKLSRTQRANRGAA